jgi:hypothetical protein
MDKPSQNTLDCIEACLRCYGVCLGMATNHCLAVGGKHAEQDHLRLMLACSEMCRTHAHFLILGSVHAKHLAPECAELCRLCAESCEKVGDMDDCVAACRACAASCAGMAA